jgi:hypothetical protein
MCQLIFPLDHGRLSFRQVARERLVAQAQQTPETCAAQAALRYLERRLDQMDYFDFKTKGYPIGSGQIEGANKSVIGARMKCGGMRWSKQGINRMAVMRSNQCSAKPFLDFDTTRLLAFAP